MSFAYKAHKQKRPEEGPTQKQDHRDQIATGLAAFKGEVVILPKGVALCYYSFQDVQGHQAALTDNRRWQLSLSGWQRK